MGDMVRQITKVFGRRWRYATLLVTTLAIGLGSATVIFTLVDRLLIRPLPFPEPDRLVSLTGTPIRLTADGPSIAPELARLEVLSSIAFYESTSANAGDRSARRVRVAAVDERFFDVLSVPPLIGRTFRKSEPTYEHSVVISHGFWRGEFGGADAILGQQLVVNGRTCVVRGVMPRGFGFPDGVDLWLPTQVDTQLTGGAFRGKTFARLAPGVSLAAADSAVFAAYVGRYGKERVARMPQPLLTPLSTEMSRSARPTVMFLFWTVGLLLVATWSNVSALQISRLPARATELMVRQALGATPRNVVGQMMLEAFVPSALGTALACCIAIFALKGVTTIVPGHLAESVGTADGRFIAIICLLSVASAIAVGSLPAWVAIRQSGPSQRLFMRSTLPISLGLERLLTITQLSFCTILLAGALATWSGVVGQLRVDLGFHNDRAIVFQLTLPKTRYPTPRDMATFVNELETRLRSSPGITSVGSTNMIPGGAITGLRSSWLTTDSAPVPLSAPKPPLAALLAATPHYFQTTGVRLIAGRSFGPADAEATAPVVILNEAAARRVCPDASQCLGTTLHMDHALKPGTAWYPSRSAEVIGIVETQRAFGLSGESPLLVYLPMSQLTYLSDISVVVDAQGGDDAVVALSRRITTELDASLPIYGALPLRALTRRLLESERLTAAISLSFAIASLVVCAVGVYGVIGQQVIYRRLEWTMRVALGARREWIAATIVVSALRLMLVSAVIGALCTTYVVQRASQFLPYLGRPSVTSIVAAVAVLGTVVVIAAYLAARPILKLELATVLKTELSR